MNPALLTDSPWRHNDQPVGQARFEQLACDPARHVVVEACAGAGKTWLLVERMVRALQAGCAPHEILAITFTRKAAGEMRARLDERLRRGDPALYRRVLEHGRAPEIRTFHGWFAQLLGLAPIAVLDELGLPAAFELVEDDLALIGQLWPRLYQALHDEPAARADYLALVARCRRHGAREALDRALARRIEFELADIHGTLDDALPPAHVLWPDLPEGGPGAWLASAPVADALHAGAQALLTLGVRASKQGRLLVAALESADLRGIAEALLTKGQPRKLADLPVVHQAQQVAIELMAAQHQDEARTYHQCVTRLARLVLREYRAFKQQRRLIDMADVERAAHRLLSDDSLGGWIQERLDQRVRHLLVDEFQDTNPMQWQALCAWLQAYAGAGGGAQAPSVFIVGDPKQSIYRFRRAEPQVFRAATAFVTDMLGGERLSCDLTRRCAPQVVELVNQAMLAAQRDGDYEGFRPHLAWPLPGAPEVPQAAHMANASDVPDVPAVGSAGRPAGAVLALPLIERPAKATRTPGTPGDSADAPQATPADPQDEAPSGDWRDSLAESRRPAEEEGLRQRECRQAADWIAHQLAQGERPDAFMVLARKKERLEHMAAELRERGVAHVFTEPGTLIDSPVVQDIVALIDGLIAPANALALARALRSPLFGLDDAQLLDIAAGHASRAASGGWLDTLQSMSCTSADGREVGATLLRWRDWLRRWPPHDALQAIYHDGDVLARYQASLPATMLRHAAAELQALLDAALGIDGGRYLDAHSLVRALRRGEWPLPPVMQDQAVRLLTIHGAKGLEADHVLLLDTDAAPARADSYSALVDWPGERVAPRLMAFVASESAIAPSLADALAAEQAARSREELNALYVALTRARRTLVISAVQAHQDPGRSWWRRLSPLAQRIDAPDAAQQPAGLGTVPARPGSRSDAPRELLDLPALRRAGAGALTEGAGDPPVGTAPDTAPDAAPDAAPGAAPGTDETQARAARRGQALHRLLEWWPQIAAPGPSDPALRPWPAWQLRALEREFALDSDDLQAAIRLALAIRHGQAAWAWDLAVVEQAANEVEWLHQGRRLRLDRLVRRRDDGVWWVLDYKSSLMPQRSAELRAQLLAYRQALADTHGPQRVRAALVAGDGALLPVD